MKKFLVMAVFAVLAALPLSNVNAQGWGVGVVGGIPSGIQVKKYNAGTSLDFRGHFHNNGFQLAGLYEWNQSIGNGLTLYYGVGAGLGAWEHGDKDMGFGLDIEGIVGVEWKLPINFPLAISLDYRPAFQIMPTTGFEYRGFAFGVKYLF